MRQAFINTLEKEAGKNKQLILLTGDLGFTVFEKFMKKYPEQFFNLGVAEANMMGVATGLALSGKIPFVYSIAPFVTLRPYEQIRNDICMHKANVKIVGVGGGFAYTHAGPTHHICEDLAAMRLLPNMTVLCPADAIETKLAVKAAIKLKGPVYIRLGKHEEPDVHTRKFSFSIGKGVTIKDGTDIALISCGPITHNVLLAAVALKKKGISASVISMHTIKPLDTKLLDQICRKYKAAFTIEEHSLIGGLGGAVAEYIVENSLKPMIFKRIGISDKFCLEIGDYEYIRDYYSLSTDKLVETILKTIK